MPRPEKCRRIGFDPEHTLFKPAGVPGRDLEQVTLTLDELEAVRLADWLGLYQDRAAGQMGVSRQTFGNILTCARAKLADCVLNGKMLRIEGGNTVTSGERSFRCAGCGREWSVPCGGGRPGGCPACGAKDFHRSPGDPRGGHGRGGGPGRCGRDTQDGGHPAPAGRRGPAHHTAHH